MKGSLDNTLKIELKQMIVEESDKDIDPQTITDEEPLFGEESGIQLDSLDAIQLSMAIQKKYGIKVTDSKEARRAFATVNSLADLIQPE
ncbi:MAG: phosphopantetheine-binding protein [Gammaproteobacteria bacterium]|jgi:acyl carrier protein|nr:phosphopantetheine-binding protein [Gammaproteobacteria bacterium]